MSTIAQAPLSSVHDYSNKNAKAHESHSELSLLKTTRKAASAASAWLEGHYSGTVKDSQIDSQAWLADEYAKSGADMFVETGKRGVNVKPNYIANMH
ncbi:hypothetical protein Moror_15562 [Moniliophthora roreri MCA 2997]|uniref:Uncharacterized protein n=1 Tax=Moniliophthora roreri (strain MCA 2997) TaxID=1381753 RepID=V2XM69_MONRO|nr:hypothetical protein Moror_15562 [Moniliophthora roreri MCA 2997]